MNEAAFMNSCFQLARLGLGFTLKNPLVGAIIVHGDRIIGEGYHRTYGQDHGEIQALKSVDFKDRDLIPQSTLYVNLEPCSHHGKTPPCADEIINQGIKKVVVGCLDPNPKVNGEGIRRLRAHGVEVILSSLQSEAIDLNKVFFKNINEGRPYVILKFAKSIDHLIGNSEGQVQISNLWSRYLVHKIRHQVEAILIGTNTALIDNPRLTNRLYYGKSPIRIVLDQSGRIPDHFHVLSDGLPTWLITNKTNHSYPSNVRVIPWIDDIRKLLTWLYMEGIGSLLVEGGARTLQSFIDLHTWDELWQTTGVKTIGSGTKPPHFNGILTNRFYIHDDCLEVYRPIIDLPIE